MPTLLPAAALPLLALFAGAPQAPPADTAPPAYSLYLVTVGPGDQVWERFGHNAIWVRDEAAGTDRVYNYGLFSFQQEGFLLRFLEGRMRYWMAGFEAEPHLAEYVARDRTVWRHELNLTAAQRQELVAFLRWNAQPENRFYRYDYYRDNCSTRIRDALDRVVGGAIRAQSGAPTGATWRFHTQRLTAPDPLIYIGTLAGLGQPVDRPVSAWDEMFLPMLLLEHLHGVTVVDDGGRERPLIGPGEVWYVSSAPAPPDRPPAWMPRFLLAGVALAAVLLALARRGRRHRLARIGFGLAATGWSLLLGAAGTVLLGLWTLTDHVAASANENLFMANPLALGLAGLCVPLAAGWTRSSRAARLLADLVAAATLTGCVLQVLPGLDQVNGQLYALVLPVNLALALGVRTANST